MPRIRSAPTAAVVIVLAIALAVGTVVAARPRPAAAATAVTVPIMGPNILTAPQIAAWYNSRQHAPYKVPGIGVQDLAQVFLWEGSDENVRGDLAFAQSIVETGWFGFVGSIVKPANWNFAGMGVCDSCNSGRQFSSPQMGIRAQIQDLRNYADISSRASNLRHPPVPEWYAWPSLNPATAARNFDQFFRKGNAPTWNQMGNGNHATSPAYASAVISVYQSMLTYVGLPPEAAAGADPVGNLEQLQRVPEGVHISGWTIDPSAPSPTAVDVYVNGRSYVRRMANGSRPDVSAAFAFAGPSHGFDMVLPIAGGTVCVYAINIGAGVRNPSLGCRYVPGPAPMASLDGLTRDAAGLHVRGWALDPDSAAPIRVDVYANGVGVARLSAETSRPDVGARWPGYGDAHGFDAVLPGVGGNVCLYAINVGSGANTALGCRTVLGTNPIGHVDAVTRQPGGGVRITGWALDPDSAGPATVDIYANGAGFSRVSTGGARPDVAAAFPGYGATRGFDVFVPILGGTVCAYGINAGAGANVLLGCRNV